ncbi:unnamed protein product, partial [Allacma fusca]
AGEDFQKNVNINDEELWSYNWVREISKPSYGRDERTVA